MRLGISMGCPPSILLKQIDSRELTEMLLFMEIEPFGPQATNLNFGSVTAMLRNVNRASKNTKIVTPMEMALGEFDSPKALKMTGEQMGKVVKELVMAVGGETITKEERARRVAARMERYKKGDS